MKVAMATPKQPAYAKAEFYNLRLKMKKVKLDTVDTFSFLSGEAII